MEYEKLVIAYRKNIITAETLEKIESYHRRLDANNLPVIYNLRHIRKIFGIIRRDQELYFGKERAKLYRNFEIPKKSGGRRKIEAPVDRLKNIQRWIKDEIVDSFSPNDAALGFRKGFSIVDNAIRHVGKELVINLDIKDFFPSITYDQVLRMFVYMGYKLEVAHLLTKLCTNSKNALPQGSPASPSISNIILLKLDKRLSCLANSIGSDYSRYADDLTFSGNKNIKNVVPLVKRIVHEEGYVINEKKVRLQYSNQRQEVTGLTVNSCVMVSRKLIKEIDNAIYYCNKYGIDDHMKFIKCNKHFYRDHLYGVAYFIKMVNEEKGEKYLVKLSNIDWDKN